MSVGTGAGVCDGDGMSMGMITGMSVAGGAGGRCVDVGEGVAAADTAGVGTAATDAADAASCCASAKSSVSGASAIGLSAA